MAEPQLVDYIKKARQAGQQDEQSRAMLQKNGWTEAEINDAFLAINQPQPQPQQQPQQQPQIQPQQQPKPQYKAQPTQSSMPKTKAKSHLASKILIILVILVVIGGIVYYTIAETNLVQSVLNIFSVSTKVPAVPVVKNNTPVKNAQTPAASGFATAKLATVLQNYDVSKITVYSFSQAGDSVTYCVPQKNSAKVDCFLNNQKLDNPYNYKPYWILVSPGRKRVVSLYSDPITKQSFTFENSKEGTRYDGLIGASKFSDDSQSFLYVVAGKDNKSFVVLDGKAFSPHDKIYGTPSLSNDKKYIFYGARDGQDLFWIADAVK